ncbi:MAG TPA: hypothetical protein PLU17_14020, partial [Chitinophagaceae bacterium]|nr:hypothetical protein [Chitinophagaceae bacterium]
NWSNGNTSSSATSLAAGTYTVIVTDNNSATSSCVYTVTQPSVIIANCTGTNVTTNGGNDGSVSIAPATGGTNSFSTSSSISFPGSPFISVGPIATVSTITIPSLPSGAIINSATLNLIGVEAINGSFKSEFLVSLTGDYTLVPTQVSTINSPGLITPDPSINLVGFPASGGVINLRLSEQYNDPGDDANLANANIEIAYTYNGYSYLWSNGNTTTSNNGLIAGTYSVVVTDAIGCTSSCAHTITQPLGSFNISSSAGSNGSITPSGISSVTSGANQTYSILPDACYEIANVLIDGVNNPGAVSSGSYTFNNVTASHTISATFNSISTTNTSTVSSCIPY